ncbi:hypothetical protein LPB90_18505 [Chryseobacterium sp. LC2016-29]|uniref:hypothetical protein n=1 Tax=Chryseobacterium sp. LC2016-29 TaxID=2897331 RepID=UPI001E35A158|nr:hypothetical protein [Chryseobacterium sp. LC2016-29]MCD0480435.1 hypothetical protein [Chryseobacterium sp. LC2016-29]
MFNHYGKFLPFAGKPVKYESNEIEIMIIRSQRLKKELDSLNIIIEGKEKDFKEFIAGEWTEEEIDEAKKKSIEHSSQTN